LKVFTNFWRFLNIILGIFYRFSLILISFLIEFVVFWFRVKILKGFSNVLQRFFQCPSKVFQRFFKCFSKVFQRFSIGFDFSFQFSKVFWLKLKILRGLNLFSIKFKICLIIFEGFFVDMKDFERFLKVLQSIF
jgi:hypothetical protein